ncbi:flagellar protein FlaG [Planococcus sp. 107-1]|uniref:flagellar protein FlaG n=1 Tax=Planococcus sp. 107-1 TaxID=2908840 RepID=UPI001F27BFFF|nr:flagellar protein FlaG [Planococcus sp. 107-1]UJF27089.1 flagellar protein FlaG [Planococcus sp. 107-1]
MEVKQPPVVYIPVKTPEAAVVSAAQPKEKTAEFEIEKTMPVTKEKLIEKVEGMNDFLEPTNTSVKFQFHDELGEYYVQVIDTITDEVIKEIPNKKFLDMYASMAEFAGLLVDEKL